MSRETDDRYERCAFCQEARASGDWPRALACSRCRGQGIRRKPTSYLCNQCAGPLTVTHDQGDVYGLVEHSLSGHYSSDHLTDTTVYTFSLCEKCLRALFNGFTVPPRLAHYHAATGELDPSEPGRAYAEDREWHEFSVWLRAGGQEKKLATGRCTYREHCIAPQAYREFSSSELSHLAPCEAHKGLPRALNCTFVPIALVAGIPARRQDYSDADRLRVLAAWLTFGVHPGYVITWLTYLPSCVRDAIHLPPDTGRDTPRVGGLWVPACFGSAVPWTSPELGLQYATFDGGLLLYGDAGAVRRIARDPGGLGIGGEIRSEPWRQALEEPEDEP